MVMVLTRFAGSLALVAGLLVVGVGLGGQRQAGGQQAGCGQKRLHQPAQRRMDGHRGEVPAVAGRGRR